jgi:hypothetical protein
MPDRESMLRARLAEQERTLEQLRAEVGWLTQELVMRDSGVMPYVDGAPPEWRSMLQAIRRLVHRSFPDGARIACVSSGVEAVLRHAGPGAEHLSQDAHGDYVGTPPSCGRVAIAQLEAARWRGVEALLIPRSELWWFEHFPDFERHLDDRYARVADDEVAGVIWCLREPGRLRGLHDLLAGLEAPDRRPALLDWHTGEDLASVFGELSVFAPLGDPGVLPYLDATVDVVAVRGADRVAEARRVASKLVLSFSGDGIDVAWQADDVDGSANDVSILVVSRDGGPAVNGYLERLPDALPATFNGEVVIDDACVPDARLEGITVVECPARESYADRLARCAAAASGELLVVLDCATWPVPGFLHPLTSHLRVGDAVLVTGSLVLPDGRLHADPEARPDAVRHSFVRPVDQVPRRFFAARRQLILGGGRARATQLYEPAAVAIASWEARPAETIAEVRVA